MTLAPHVRTLARGQGRSRSLTQDEAQDAMAQMLAGGADPEAIGAILMLLRMKGETAEEIAGFTAAAQMAAPVASGVDLDWSSYAAGRTRGAPWFLHSARLVADAGYRVLIHGWNGPDMKIRDGLGAVGITMAETGAEAARLLDRDGIAYLKLETAHPALFHLLNLRPVFGLRSCVNTVCRMLNPARAGASVQGVFHPSYRELQADAAALLGWQQMTVIKGGGGEFERHPGKEIAAFGLRDGLSWEAAFPALSEEVRRLKPSEDAGFGPFEEQIILGTAALALETLAGAESTGRAGELWQDCRFRPEFTV
ncbi:glycosyl transferase family protein [Pseudooceanicola sp. C21-150M6]|uniref:glycosyl transferase family protein n=1 Tax=Pseudooceanicola sp. C21-150M6 TaxID=3434355 RepID=UPI003D7F6A34